MRRHAAAGAIRQREKKRPDLYLRAATNRVEDEFGPLASRTVVRVVVGVGFGIGVDVGLRGVEGVGSGVGWWQRACLRRAGCACDTRVRLVAQRAGMLVFARGRIVRTSAVIIPTEVYRGVVRWSLRYQRKYYGKQCD